MPCQGVLFVVVCSCLRCPNTRTSSSSLFITFFFSRTSPPPCSLSTPPSHPQENWQLVGETLNVYRENEEVVYKGDSPGQFMGFTTKTYDLYDPAVNKEACKKGGEGFPYNKDKGCPVAKATIRKGCWFVFCAFWKKEVRGNGGGWGK
jgi:hypothetical protein